MQRAIQASLHKMRGASCGWVSVVWRASAGAHERRARVVGRLPPGRSGPGTLERRGGGVCGVFDGVGVAQAQPTERCAVCAASHARPCADTPGSHTPPARRGAPRRSVRTRPAVALPTLTDSPGCMVMRCDIGQMPRCSTTSPTGERPLAPHPTPWRRSTPPAATTPPTSRSTCTSPPTTNSQYDTTPQYTKHHHTSRRCLIVRWLGGSCCRHGGGCHRLECDDRCDGRRGCCYGRGGGGRRRSTDTGGRFDAPELLSGSVRCGIVE